MFYHLKDPLLYVFIGHVWRSWRLKMNFISISIYVIL